MHALQPVLDALEQRQLVVQSTDDPPVYLPARDPALISVTQVLETVRAAGEERYFSPDGLPAPRPVDALLERMRRAVDSSVGDMTLRELAAQETEPAMPDEARTDAR
jgi:membrane protein